MKQIKISNSLSLPIEAVTQTQACIGKRGAGKTYLASMIAEQMLDIGAQVIILDPVGNWWGLRVAADGKGKGKDIFVIGGDHGDVPIGSDAGARIAKLLVEKRVSAILDISEFRQGERKRFAADFAEELFHLKKAQRSAVHIFIEEAQLFAPQSPRAIQGSGIDEMRMLGAFESIIRLGRNYGIGATLITQRPQSVNKEVLSQTECLYVLQVNGAHERKALEEWVQQAGADRKLVDELPGLSQGEGYVWSPSWLRIYKRMQFAPKTTFDVSATPKVGAATKAAQLSAIDVESLKADLQDVIAQSAKDDPKALRKRIAELEEASRKINPHLENLVKQATNELNEKRSQLSSMAQAIEDRDRAAIESAARVNQAHVLAKQLAEVLQFAMNNQHHPRPAPVRPMHISAPLERKPPASVHNSNSEAHSGLGEPHKRILNAIAWFEQVGVVDPEQPAVAFMAGYTSGGGAFNNPRSRLNTLGLVEYVSGNRIRLTEAGRQLAAPGQLSDRTNEALHAAVLARLPTPAQRILQPLLVAYPSGMSNADLAKAASYTPNAGAFNNPRGRLKTMGLIEYPNPGIVRARDLLFPNH